MTIRRLITGASVLCLVISARGQTARGLAIKPASGQQVQVAWPADAGLSILQQAQALGSTNGWSNVSQAPAISGTNYGLLLQASNAASFYRLATRPGSAGAPLPDPSSEAPTPQPNRFNNLESLTEFLYTGPNPLQVGVAAGTISPSQAAVIRGTVRRSDNSPLPGVRVALVGHPEYGFTFTRTNGMFDLAVNASTYLLDFQAVGYCSAQRTVTARSEAYLSLPDVVLAAFDSISTTVSFGSNSLIQTAQSTVQADAAGSRSAMVIVPAGTTASLVLADGTTQAVEGLTLRATEFTVGPNGRSAMPATLPTASEYTYCAEFSADEALGAGARSVQFSQPLPVYVDNFLKMPVGMLVPSGWYDRQHGVWVPSMNGIVMAVLGTSNGLALVDLHGKGQPESSDVLTTNGFTTGELQLLAALYSPGKTLWRMPVPHFSIWDFNFGGAPPDPKKPNRPGDKPKCDPCDTSNPTYGTVNFSAMTFSERIPLVGVPFDLNYNSARVPGYQVDSQLTIPVTWQPPPNPCGNAPAGTVCMVPPHYFDPPAAIRVDMDIEGESLSETIAATNQFATIAWDGRDGYGRVVGGTREAKVTVAYEFPDWGYSGVCCGPELSGEFPALFGNFGNQASFEAHAGTTLGVGAVFQQLLTYPDHRQLGFGGWSPTVLHRLDPLGGILYYGDGRIRRVPQQSALDNFQSRISYMQGVAAAGPDGSSYYFGYVDGSDRLFRRRPNGTYELLNALPGPGIASVNGADWSQINGKPDSQVSLHGIFPRSMAVGPDGSVYIADNFAIAQLTPDRIWHGIVGDMGQGAVWPPTFQPDGTPAPKTFIGGYTSLAVGPDNTLYYTSTWGASQANGTNYMMVRKIAGNGRIYTVFGGAGVAAGQLSTGWASLLGTAAASAPWYGGGVNGLAVGADGSIYVSLSDGQYSSGIARITPAGMLAPFLSGRPVTRAGYYALNPADTNSVAQVLGDEGKPANQSGDFDYLGGGIINLQVGPDGSVYFTADGYVIWRINPNGVLERFAGRYSSDSNPPANIPADHADPLNTFMYPTTVFAIGPDGSLLLVYPGNPTAANPGITIYPERNSKRTAFVSDQIQIPSEDGTEIYLFDSTGRHLSTLDSLVGATKWSFSYDAHNLPVAITDAAGQTTQITRNNSGVPTAITGPYGQTTTLALDSGGFLKAVTNPANQITVLSNSAGGLLTAISGPRGDTYSISYDTLGRVSQVADPMGGGVSGALLDRGVLGAAGYEFDISFTNSLAEFVSRYLQLRPNGDTYIGYQESAIPLQTTVLFRQGDQSTFRTDGSVSTTTLVADPRFGGQANQVAVQTLSLPSGTTYKANVQRSAGLTNPFDPLSLTGLTNRLAVNGNTYVQTYNPTNRSMTLLSPSGRVNTTVLDLLARPVHLEAPGQGPVDIAYDPQGRVAAVTNASSEGPRTTTFAYNALGQVKAIVDPVGRGAAFSFDAAGNLQQQSLTDGSSVQFAHDSERHLTSLTLPSGAMHSFEYNPAGLLTKYSPPLVGSDNSVTYSYDTERNLKRVDFPDGQVMSFQRGLGGRTESLSLGAGETLSFGYSTVPGSGNLLVTNISSSSGTSVQLAYDAFILTNVSWSGSITGTVSLHLNADLLPASVSVDGSPITLNYDSDRLLTQAGSLALTRDQASGLVTSTSQGAVSDQRSYSVNGLLTNYSATVNGTSVWSIHLSYDPLDRITNKTEQVNGATRNFAYQYDSAGRLAQVWQDGVLGSTYTYDTNGNRIAHNLETATYDAQDRVLSYGTARFAWSANGFLLSRTNASQITTYNYDLRGHLTGVGLADGREVGYLLDPSGHRIGKTINGNLVRGWLWGGGLPMAEVDSNSQPTAQFVYGARPCVPDFIIKSNVTFRVLSDERGSVRLVINTADGSIAQQLDYDEFGRVLVDSNPGFQPFGFAGGLYDPDTGLVRFGLRDFDSTTGQWLGRDPLGFRGGLGLYAYAHNDPINWIDPLGAGPWSTLAYNGLKTAVGGLGAAAALFFLPEEAVGVAGAVVVVAAVNSGYTLVSSTLNAVILSQYGNDIPLLPTSLASVLAYVTGDSPDSQRGAAVADLSLGLASPAPHVGFDIFSAFDNTLSAWGLTPGSKAPGCP